MQAGTRLETAAPLLHELVQIIVADGTPPASSSKTPNKTPEKHTASDRLGAESSAGQKISEAYLWSVPELAGIASVLLNLLYELCGKFLFPCQRHFLLQSSLRLNDQPASPGPHCLLNPLNPVIGSFHLGQLCLWSTISCTPDCSPHSSKNSSQTPGLTAMSVATVCPSRASDG